MRPVIRHNIIIRRPIIPRIIRQRRPWASIIIIIRQGRARLAVAAAVADNPIDLR